MESSQADYVTVARSSPHIRSLLWRVKVTYFLLTCAQQLPATTIGITLVQELHLTAAQVTAYYALTFSMWTLRPLYGIISDQLPLFGFRRKSYLVCCALFCALFMILQGSVVSSVAAFTSFAVMLNVFHAFCEVIVDSISIELGNCLAVDSIENISIPRVFDTLLWREEDADDKLTRSSSEIPSVSTDEPLLRSEQLHVPSAPHNELIFSSANCLEAEQDSHAASFSEAQLDLKNQTSTCFDDTSSCKAKSLVQAECMAIRTGASVVAAAASIALLYLVPGRWVFYITSLLFIAVIPVALSLMEQRVSNSCWSVLDLPIDGGALEATRLRLLTNRFSLITEAAVVLWRPLLFLFIINLMPTSTDAYFTFIYSSFSDFADWQFSLYQFIGMSGSMIGVQIYKRYLTGLSIRRVFQVCTVIACAMSSMQLMLVTHLNRSIGIPDSIFVPINSFIYNGVNYMATMPPIILAANASPSKLHLEASMFSACQAVAHVASLISAGISAWLATYFGLQQGHFDQLWQFIVICNCLSLVSLAALRLLPSRISE